jgi:uncharacterized Ntn-hydrolase superfamily protein
MPRKGDRMTTGKMTVSSREGTNWVISEQDAINYYVKTVIDDHNQQIKDLNKRHDAMVNQLSEANAKLSSTNAQLEDDVSELTWKIKALQWWLVGLLIVMAVATIGLLL